MRFIDYIRQDPMVLDPTTGTFSYDARQLFTADTQVFVVDEIASLVIEKGVNHPDKHYEEIQYTEWADEFLKIRPVAGEPGMKRIHTEEFVGVVPPFENCFFEYRHPKSICPPFELNGVRHEGSPTEFEGVHIESIGTPEALNLVNEHRRPEDPKVKFVMKATVFYRVVGKQRGVIGIDGSAFITADEEGRVLSFSREARATPQQKEADPACAVPNLSQFLVTLLSMMLLGTKLGRPTISPEPVKSRQQRRYEQRHPDRATPHYVRYWTLDVDPTVVDGGGSRPGTGKGGWEVAWHRVRGHLRHLKSGKVVPVRAHSKGNPLKGVVFKDYAVLSPQEVPSQQSPT